MTTTIKLGEKSILAHIAADNANAAKNFLLDALQQIASLKNYPSLGRAGLVPSTRELVVHENYVVYYRVKKEQIEILRVLHTRRKYP